jgi:hypothetical protein
MPLPAPSPSRSKPKVKQDEQIGLSGLPGGQPGTADEMWNAIIGNLTGSKPTDPLGDVVQSIRQHLTSPGETGYNPNPIDLLKKVAQGAGQVFSGAEMWPFTKGIDYGGYHAPAAFNPTLPTNRYGVTPEGYTPSNEVLIHQVMGGKEGTQGLAALQNEGLLKPTVTDKEYETLEKEAASGNTLAMKLLDAYRPKFGISDTQYEEGLVHPFVQTLQDLPDLYKQLEATQPDQSLPSVLSDVQQVAQAYSGISPQAPNTQTEAVGSQYANIGASTAAAIAPIMNSALKDLGSAAEISMKTFPYQTLIQDLINRYAYQIESPSYPPPAFAWPGLPSDIAKLFQEATGSAFGGGTIGSGSTTIGSPDTSGISTPALQPAANPSYSG